jgi:hypothetical protein
LGNPQRGREHWDQKSDWNRNGNVEWVNGRLEGREGGVYEEAEGQLCAMNRVASEEGLSHVPGNVDEVEGDGEVTMIASIHEGTALHARRKDSIVEAEDGS